MIMEEKENNSSIILKLLLLLFVIFLILYLSKETGIYEYKTYTKTHLTNEAIKKFESDLDKGLDVTLNDYIIPKEKNYTNIVNKTGSFINNGVENIMNNGIKKTIKILKKLFYE